jgi:CheY-like chemotaxis protein
VVDDMENMCSLLERFLANDTHTVKTADSGSRTIEVLKVEAFDLVLCDLVMPDVSGYKVVETLNRLEKRPKIGVMIGWSEKIEGIYDVFDL